MDLRARLAVHFPAYALEVRTPRLTLRYPNDEDLLTLVDIVADGVHDPDFMPFSVPWTRAESPHRERNTLLYFWRQRALQLSDAWQLPLVVVVDGEVVGTQALFAKSWGVARTFETGSWIGQRFHGQGIGTEMRAAALHLGFAGLDAARAVTDAWHDNGASLGVTRKMGYRPNGDALEDRDGQAVPLLAFALDRADWEGNRRNDIVLIGADAVRDSLGSERPVGPPPPTS